MSEGVDVILMPGAHGDKVADEESKYLLALSPHRDVDQDDQISRAVCYRRTPLRTCLVTLGGLLTLGFLWLFMLWYVRFRAWALYRKCESDKATHLLVSSQHLSRLEKLHIRKTTNGQLPTFSHRFLHYFVDGNTVRPLLFETSLSYSTFHGMMGSDQSNEAKIQLLRDTYGPCKLEIPEPNWCSLLVSEVLTPFVLFQCYSIGLWCYEGYIWYAIAIFLLTAVSVIINLIVTKRQIHRVQQLAGESYPVNVIRGGRQIEINSAELVHGDIVVVTDTGKIPCDLVLTSGSCVMKEGLLTGEPTPVIKESIPNRGESLYDIDKDKLHTLYQGTETMQATPCAGQTTVLAVAVRTGFHTLKGKLIRNILFPKPNRFRFFRESLLFILILVTMAIVGFLITLYQMLDSPLVDEDVAIRCLDLITIAVPPLLPTAMVVGTVFAIHRLKKQQIYCISPPRVNVSGEIRFMVFDKTGTLTEDSMALYGIVASADSKQRLVQPQAIIQDYPLFLENLIVCHSLKVVDGGLVGDVMDRVIFESTKWQITPGEEEGAHTTFTGPEGTVIQIKHIFHFDSALKRMGVVACGFDFARFHVKGAPETIVALCNPASVPANIATLLETFNQKGQRVIACATGPVSEGLPAEQLEAMKIDDLEKELTFLGIVVLENKLKKESADSIAQLRQAETACTMATGDSQMTGLAIARECGIIPKDHPVFVGEMKEGQQQWSKYTFPTDIAVGPTINRGLNEATWLTHLPNSEFSLVLTGELFADLVEKSKREIRRDQGILRICLENCRVFARMSPEQKTMLIEQLQNTGALIGMCGDGANDCGALKAADIGISFSEAEASIAAPFSSKVPNISAVITILQEGRCALATSFMCFKYMALYSMIQFSTVCILFWWGSYLPDLAFLFEDVFMVLPLTVAMSYTSAYTPLSKRTPGDSLLTLPILMSVIGNGLLAFASQVMGYGLLSEESWYVPVNADDPETEEGKICAEVTVVWTVANFNYLATVVLFMAARPFRKVVAWTSVPFLVWFLWMIAVSVCVMLAPPYWVRDLLQLVDLERDFKGKLLGVTMAYVAAAIVYEKGVMWGVESLYNRKKERDRQKQLAAELSLE